MAEAVLLGKLLSCLWKALYRPQNIVVLVALGRLSRPFKMSFKGFLKARGNPFGMFSKCVLSALEEPSRAFHKALKEPIRGPRSHICLGRLACLSANMQTAAAAAAAASSNSCVPASSICINCSALYRSLIKEPCRAW
jgi:hypothetical protein